MAHHKMDKDLRRITGFEAAVRAENKPLVKLGLSLLFLVLVFIYAAVAQSTPNSGMFIVAAAVIGGYMAMNIGANDVANNIGPAVGSRALTMVGALIIAAIFEASGAILAGGDVVSTIRKGIVDPASMADTMTFIWAMMAALLAAALWLNLATWIGAPVSTTHSVVGGVMGAGIAAAGFASVDWGVMGKIALSWVVSPVLGGVVAALFLAFVKKMVLFQEDKIAAARTWVPVLVGIMAAAFTFYLGIKGLKKIVQPDPVILTSASILAFAGAWALTRYLVGRASDKLENRRSAVAKLFTVPLIFSAALLSFAHGANDVANAVGPLAAIVSAAQDIGATGVSTSKVTLPLWVMMIGAVGISVGLVLFGPKLIRTVGEQITKLNRIRAFCVALSASITVIAASWLGLPVSSTHIAVGGVFGVGFLREYIANKNNVKVLTSKEKRKREKRKLVRRRHLMGIAAAWVITVPLSASLSALLFYIFIRV